MKGHTNSQLHRDGIELDPDTLKVLILLIHEFIHQLNLFHKLFFGGYRGLLKFEHFCLKRF